VPSAIALPPLHDRALITYAGVAPIET